ncbi:MAG: carbohydrate ABC transporter permease [Limnochordia bacterium]|mgnify:FL=1|jgi:multiple sugar transport system permease protein|nr:carbohydrate ABC transporter permease [Limnochordia bacterium]MDI9466150.1 carbohydrate ABC transporter permease [Bacillota bacterium]HOB40980.1 carbohydrate ABC transporter permease [Limnochordia bacterium]HPT83909.1 carbohydrate ABC transporter permease [Limnochordia bacterium]HPZ80484.1 carbohydrate ABC transporter permease [Limnochordia bacterium]
MDYRLKNLLAKAVMQVCLLLFVVFLAFPLVWMLSTSLKPNPEIYARVPSLIPKEPTLDHFRVAFGQQDLLSGIYNSFKIGVISSLVVLVLAVPAAYALVRFKTVINKSVMAWILVSQLFPSILIIIPLFVVLRNLALTNSHIGIILVYTVWSLPFVLWMMRSYVQGIPEELEEAAFIDGCSRLQVLSKIVFPLLLPGIVASGLFAFVSAWNEFFFALVLLKSPKLTTLPVYLSRFTGSEGMTRLGPLAASCLVATIPTLVVFTFLQKGLVSGLMSGAVKQ